jgi:kynurenine formamidase
VDNTYIDLTEPIRNGITVRAPFEFYQHHPTKVEVIACFSPKHAERLAGMGRKIADDAATDYLAVTSSIAMTTHTGTHLDAPGHIDPDGIFIDELPLELLEGRRAAVFDVSGVENLSAVTREHLAAADPGVQTNDWAIISTGWNESLGDGVDGNRNEGAPYLEHTGAEYLLEKRVVGVALDCASDEPLFVDVPWELQIPVHRTLLCNGILLLENITNTSQLSDPFVRLYVSPLRIEKSDGAPCRVFAAAL